MPNVVSTDIYYALYLKQLQMIKDYDLYQLSQIAMVMTSPAASQHVPDEYWTECLHEALLDSLKEFESHKEHIS